MRPAVSSRKALPAEQALGQVGRGDGHCERIRHRERLTRCCLKDVAAVAQFEDGELGPRRLGVHDQYDGTPNFSYAAFFLFRSMSAVLGERTSTTSNGGVVNFASPTSSRWTTTRSGASSVTESSWTAGSGATR